MDKIKKNVNPAKILNTILSWTFKVIVICLFLVMFLGRLNPARISKNMNPSSSLVKTAFYFKSYVKDIVNLDSKKAETQEESSGISTETDSYDEMYAQFAEMFANADAFSAEADDDSSSTEQKSDKITIQKFSSVWEKFSNEYPEIAKALQKERISAILTFIAVVITLIGVYFVFGTGKVRRIGYLISCIGAIFTSFSMINFSSAYTIFSTAPNSSLFNPSKPFGYAFYIIFSILIFACALALLFTEKQEKEIPSQFSEKPFQYTYRVIALVLFVLLFIPGANPARISERISRNVSLFTSAFSYKTYISNLENILIRGYLPYYVVRIAFAGSLFTCLGILAIGVGSCMSIGNNKLKRIAHICLFAGSAVAFVSLFVILYAYDLISSSPNIDRVQPREPGNIMLHFVFLAIVFGCSLVSFIKTPAPEKGEKCKIEAPYQLFLMILPFLILVFLFSYLPLWGWRYAFFDYNAGDTLSMDKWVGWKWFKAPFENAATRNDIIRVMRNTLAMSGLGIAFSWLPMIFAIFLAEIRNSVARRVIQTLTTIPNFISWVLVYAIAFCIFGTEGFISSLMKGFGIWDKGKNMLMGDSHIWLKMWLWGSWKGLGWSAIMYIAAISGIDQQLYEAATVDGAGRFQKIWHITIPELFPTYVVLLILSVSNILSNGMDQYLVFKNPTNKDSIEVLDLYVYQLSFGQTSNSQIPFSTVVSMFKSLVSVILLFVTNKISKWIRGSSIF